MEVLVLEDVRCELTEELLYYGDTLSEVVDDGMFYIGHKDGTQHKIRHEAGALKILPNEGN